MAKKSTRSRKDKSAMENAVEVVDDPVPSDSPDPVESTPDPPVKRKRGRPRKSPEPSPVDSSAALDENTDVAGRGIEDVPTDAGGRSDELTPLVLADSATSSGVELETPGPEDVGKAPSVSGTSRKSAMSWVMR